LSSDIKFQGPDNALILDYDFPGMPSKLSMINLEDGKTIYINRAYSPISTSPNLSEFAYVDSAHKLIISNSYLIKTKQFQGTKNWWGVIDWINDQKIVIQNMPLKNGQMYPPSSTLIFNLTTGDKTEYEPNYPEIYSFEGGAPNWGNHAFTLAVYNDSFSRVVYPAWNNDDDGPIILRSINNQQELLRLHGNDFDYGGGPQWLKDGSAFVVAVFPAYTSWRGKVYRNFNDNIPYQDGYELALVSSDGDIKRLTFLTQNATVGEEGISLSPSNSKVAFWQNMNYKSGDVNGIRQLAILDIKSGEITNLCLAGGEFPYPPIWSGDENFLLVTVSDTMKKVSDVILVDLKNEQAAIIAQNAVAVGWLTK
jgi:hypothetical protein